MNKITSYLSTAFIINKHVSLLEKMLFTKHLAVLVQSAIPLTESLTALVTQTKSAYFKKVLTDIVRRVENGSSLAQALKAYPHVFDVLYRGLITVAENSGSLGKSLQFLTDQLTKSYQLGKKIQSALMYPGIILAAALGVGGFMVVYILPQLVDFFETFNIDLPASTKILLALASFIQTYWSVLVFGFFIAGVVLTLLLRNRAFKKYWDYALLHLPFIGVIIVNAQMAHWCRNFGTLLKGGVAIVEALAVSGATLSNEFIKSHIELLRHELEKGHELGATLKRNEFNEFPLATTTIISAGEKSGSLDDSLLYLGDFYEDELTLYTKNIPTLLEPILLLIIGVLVGFIALALISPIYQLSGSVG